MSIDPESGETFLGVGSEYGGQVDSAGAFGAIESPDAFNGHGVHVHSFGAIAPAGGDGECHGDIFFFKFLCAGSGFRDASDAAVGDDDADGVAVRVAEVFLEEFFSGLSHSHDLGFQAFAESHWTAAAINNRSDTDCGVVANVSVFCHIRFLHFHA